MSSARQINCIAVGRWSTEFGAHQIGHMDPCLVHGNNIYFIISSNFIHTFNVLCWLLHEATHFKLARLKPGDDERTEISKKISWILRHGAKKVGELGWVAEELCSCACFFLFFGTWVCVTLRSPPFCAFDAQDLWSCMARNLYISLPNPA